MKGRKLGRGLALSVFLLVFLSLVVGSLNAGSYESKKFRFAVIGDTRSCYPFLMPEVFERMIKRMNRSECDFVVHVGDAILGYTRDRKMVEKEWDKFDEIRNQFTARLYRVVGDHDIWDKTSEDIYKRRYGKLYHSFDYEGSHFIILNSELQGREGAGIGSSQLRWLENDLKSDRQAAQKLVFIHRTVWPESKQTQYWEKEVHPLLVKYGVNTVFVGHLHKYSQEMHDGIRYINTGGGGAGIGAEIGLGYDNRDFHHYLIVTVREDVPYITIHDIAPFVDIPNREREIQLGIVRDWWIIGPFDLQYEETKKQAEIYDCPENPFELQVPPGFALPHPPEREINLSKSYQGKGKEIKWTRYTVEKSGLVNFDELFKPNDYVVAYGLTYVYSPEDRGVTIFTGSDDGIKLWLNDEELLNKHIQRGASPDQDQNGAKLIKGWNKILVKVEERWGGWGFYLRILSPGGLIYSPEKNINVTPQSDSLLTLPLKIIKGPYVQNLGKQTVTIMWETNESADSKVEIKGERGWVVGGTDAKPSYVHEITIDKLRPETPYYYQVRSERKRGKLLKEGKNLVAVGVFNNPKSTDAYMDLELGPASGKQLLIPKGSSGWRYTVDYPQTEPPKDKQGRAWCETDYEDTSWKGGDAPFGYGDEPRAKYGMKIPNNGGSYYFRKEFELKGVEKEKIFLKVASDNAAIVYLNGQIIHKDPCYGRVGDSGHEFMCWNSEQELQSPYSEKDMVTSEVSTFTTTPASSRIFRFAVYGDNRSRPEKHKSVIEAILKEPEGKPEFLINTGDLVANGSNYERWGSEYFGPAQMLMSSIPLWPCLGNHEVNSPLYFTYFSLPGIERWYSFDYCNAHFIALDSNVVTPGSAQYIWLEKDLQQVKTDWIFVYFHHPPYTSGGHGAIIDGKPKERPIYHAQQYLVPLFEKFDVDMVFSGHDHFYERSKKGSIYYIVSGGGGAPLYKKIGANPNQYSQVFNSILHYCIIVIDGGKLTLKVRDVESKIIDEMNIYAHME